MDDEDIADAAEAQKLQTADGFAGLGSTEDDAIRRGGLVDLFRVEGETMGVKLLKKMGWKEGQGVGPRIRRTARLDGGRDGSDTHLFAPDNTKMITLNKKTDHKGLGFQGEARLSGDNETAQRDKSEDVDEEQPSVLGPEISKKKKAARGGIGIGILNDTGSDDEDPYSIGPRISCNRIIGGEKKRKKPPADGLSNTLLKSKPVFISKKAALAKAAVNFRKCHDGRLPLDGFTLSTEALSLADSANYPPPVIPPDWKSSKIPTGSSTNNSYLSTSDAAKHSKLNPASRASILGEAALPGKSVFDYLPASARERLVSSTGKTNLPPALGEIPANYIPMTPEQHKQRLLSQIPTLEKPTALAALTRAATGTGGFIPYNDDPAKRARYLAYLSFSAGVSTTPPTYPDDSQISTPKIREDWLKALREFKDCAEIFRPMSGLMATRFTSSSSSASALPTTGNGNDETLLRKPEKKEKPEDPAEQAARLGMYGPMTRTVKEWHPTRLLCKRFNVKPPSHITSSGAGAEDEPERNDSNNKPDDLITKEKVEEMMGEYWDRAGVKPPEIREEDVEEKKPVVIDVEKNEALEGQRAGDAVFKAIFGDDSEEDD